MKQVLVLMAACLLVGCSNGNDSDKQFTLDGVWTLRQMDYPAGGNKVIEETKETLLRLYEGDSIFHQCWMTKTKTGLTIRPIEDVQVSVVAKGHGEYVYIEDDNPHPLTVKGDSAIVIQQDGILYTWHSNEDIANEWSEEIREIVAVELQKGQGKRQSYMLSRKEREQANVILGLVFSTIGVVVLLLLIARIAIDYRKEKRRLQLQLQQIQEVQQERPKAVRQAIESIETAYFASDEYQSLQRRIATGDILKDDDWNNIESQIRKVYPGFCSQLRNLHAMSELEYQVCLLIKLRVAPSDIAVVLARDASTISTVRSRLYKKVFNQKGGAREWDEFILSIGA
ncbi:MAG: hypothetical protein IJ081_02450 [Prevotella sp.]|nr:hypothetical protein [Prevotella sp.]